MKTGTISLGWAPRGKRLGSRFKPQEARRLYNFVSASYYAGGKAMLKSQTDRVSSQVWRCREHRLEIGPRTLIMGILNVTPDSFSDGGKFLDRQRALEQGLRIAEEGADIIDIGGESSRPGAEPVDASVEIARVVPVVEDLRRRTDLPISVDTCKPVVARQGLNAGADIINDITALSGGPALAELVGESGAGLVLMHMRGTPRTMQSDTEYTDLLREIGEVLEQRALLAQQAGVRKDQIVLDPGIGFGKSATGNLEILARLPELVKLGYPVLVGPSRKSFIGKILDRPTDERVWGTAATVAAAALTGASIVRVHDVRPMVDVVRMADALRAERFRLQTRRVSEKCG
jgi:dihydropteroate synthase